MRCALASMGFINENIQYNKNVIIDTMIRYAKDADIVIFGHTHVPLSYKKDNIIYINPGSLSLPRKVDYKSFCIMDIENDDIKVNHIRL